MPPRVEYEREALQNDRHDLRHQELWGVWGQIWRRRVGVVTRVFHSKFEVEIQLTEEVVDNGWTIEASIDVMTKEVLFSDVSEPDRPRVVKGQYIELQDGKGPGVRWFRVVMRRTK